MGRIGSKGLYSGQNKDLIIVYLIKTEVEVFLYNMFSWGMNIVGAPKMLLSRANISTLSAGARPLRYISLVLLPWPALF